MTVWVAFQRFHLTIILCIIYVNDLPQCSNKFDFIMYADDTTLSSTIDYFSDITSNTNADSLKS